MASIQFQNLVRRFGETRAVDDITAEIPSGSFVALLGPSGCGKTTLLRLIAGLDWPDSGAIRIGDQTVAGPGCFIGPEERRLGMVFQSYALWPHMTVAGNIAFGLNHLSRADRKARIDEALRTVGLTGFESRKPHALSGGQRQRVALARSLAARPRVLLLDEPLANLDAHLRESMLAEFRRIHAAYGCTMVFVTHDQNEAMAVANQVGVMDRGRLEQLAPPQTLFARPASPMVARFVGQGRTLPVEVRGRDTQGLCRIELGARVLHVPGVVEAGPAWLCLHSRDLSAGEGADSLPATVSETWFEDGYHMAGVMLDDMNHPVPIPLRLDHAVTCGTPMRITLRGGWVLPRTAGKASVAQITAPSRALTPA